MPIRTTRAELNDYVRSTFEQLKVELDAAGPRAGSVHCIDDHELLDAGRQDSLITDLAFQQNQHHQQFIGAHHGLIIILTAGLSIHHFG